MFLKKIKIEKHFWADDCQNVKSSFWCDATGVKRKRFLMKILIHLIDNDQRKNNTFPPLSTSLSVCMSLAHLNFVYLFTFFLYVCFSTSSFLSISHSLILYICTLFLFILYTLNRDPMDLKGSGVLWVH